MGSEGGNTTVTEAVSPTARAAVPGAALVWLFPHATGTPVGLHWDDKDELTIGRDEACAVHLTGNDVSRRHAVLRRSRPEAGVMIVDLGSRNGVRVNGRAFSETSSGWVAGSVS